MFTPTTMQVPSLPDLMSMNERAHANSFYRQKESIIRSCIDDALGNKDWIIEDVVQRMKRVIIRDTDYETITLDGEPLLEIWNPEVKTTGDGDSVKITATLKYRTFKTKNRNHYSKQ